jgi:tetratricopeptide (TPR) repeat protein
MICNLKPRLAALLAVFMLSGCASSDMFSDAKEAATGPEESAAAENLADSLEVLPEEEALSPELQQLNATTAMVKASVNRFASSKKENSPRARAMLVEALSAYQAENFDLAMTLMRQAEQLNDPLNSVAYVLQGDIYIALEDSKAAAKSYDLALSLNPDNFKAANRRALLHRELGEFTQALALYTQAIESNPIHAVSYRNRGVLFDLYLGDKAAAISDYQTYSDLLAYQQAQTDGEAGVMVSSLDAKALKREARRVDGWLIDVGRQQEAQARIDEANQVNTQVNTQAGQSNDSE